MGLRVAAGEAELVCSYVEHLEVPEGSEAGIVERVHFPVVQGLPEIDGERTGCCTPSLAERRPAPRRQWSLR